MAEQDRVAYTADDGTSFEVPTGDSIGPSRFKKWRTCDICKLDFPEDKVVHFRGLDYGIPCGCSKDIYDIRMKEKARYRARNEEIGEYET